MSVWKAAEADITDVTGCSWPLAWTDEECSSLADLDDEVRAMVEQAATDLLWAWTLQRFGLCSVTIRPCQRQDPCPPFRRSTFRGRGGSAITDRGFVVSCGCPRDRCVHSGVILPGPIEKVDKVTVDGTVLTSDEYALLGGVLVRVDGAWPTYQDTLKPSSETGTWEVVYTRGHPVPAGGQLAAGRLACELAKAYSGDASCRLPARVQSVTRQGVTASFMDPLETNPDVRTGIASVDMWVASTLIDSPRTAVSSPERRTVVS